MSTFVSNVRGRGQCDHRITNEPSLLCPTLNFHRVREEGPDGPSLDQLRLEAYREREALNARLDPTPTLNSAEEPPLGLPTLNFSRKNGRNAVRLEPPKQFAHFAPPPASSTVPQHRAKPRPALGPSDLYDPDRDDDEDHDLDLPGPLHEPRDHAGNLIIAGDEDEETEPVLENPLSAPRIWSDEIWRRAKSGTKPVGPKR